MADQTERARVIAKMREFEAVLTEFGEESTAEMIGASVRLLEADAGREQLRSKIRYDDLMLAARRLESLDGDLALRLSAYAADAGREAQEPFPRPESRAEMVTFDEHLRDHATYSASGCRFCQERGPLRSVDGEGI